MSFPFCGRSFSPGWGGATVGSSFSSPTPRASIPVCSLYTRVKSLKVRCVPSASAAPNAPSASPFISR